MEQPLIEVQVPVTPGFGQSEEIQIRGTGTHRQDIRAVTVTLANTHLVPRQGALPG